MTIDLTKYKGFRTVIVGLGLAVAPAALEYLGAVNWSSIVGPKLAFFISGIIMLGLRFVTDTAIGAKK